MFKPVMHNLEKNDPKFKLAQRYNRLIATKKLKGNTLAEKIESERKWIKKCKNALDKLNNSFK